MNTQTARKPRSMDLPESPRAEMQSKSVAAANRTTRTKTETIAVIGLGYVGLPLAVLAETRGYRVVGYDVDEIKIALLQERNAPFLPNEESVQFKKSRMRLSADERILDGALVHIVCVPTPVNEDHVPDLDPLIGACTAVGRHLKKGSLVVIESTVNPGVCETVALPVLERESGLVGEKDFFFAHCPERINPGDAKWTTRTLPRVIGASGPESKARATRLYASLIDGPITPMASLKEAEAVKMVENAFRDINIAFVNELAMSFDKAGIDLMNVIRGASTKPFAFMPHFPGCGVGGHCIPVDPYYLIRYGRENGFEHRFLMTARQINNEMPRYTVRLLEQLMRRKNMTLAGSTIALLGLAYKRDVPDLRESPALIIETELKRNGARVLTFDPFVPEKSSAHSLKEALSGADAAIIATDHTIFRSLSPQEFLNQGVNILVDGRNCLSKEAFVKSGIAYHGIGR